MAAAPRKNKTVIPSNNDNLPYHCTSCGKGFSKQDGNFNMTPSPFYAANGGYLTVCKSCAEKAFNHYKDDVFSGDADKAMELSCATFNTYYDQNIWDIAKQHPKVSNKLGLYFSKLNLNQTRGSTYADTVYLMLEQKAEQEAKIEQEAAKEVPDTEPDEIVTHEVKMRFGVGFDDDDYLALQAEYEDWVKKYGEPSDKRQDELYKNICYLKLFYLKAIQNRDPGVAGLSKEYKASIDAATTELEDRKKKEEEGVKLDPLGVWVAEIENYTPAEFYKDKKLYEDNDGIKKYFQNVFVRSFRNLFTGTRDPDPDYNISED